jgi:hypothetical protein
MAVSAKKAENDRRARPNSLSRRQRTRQENKCQLCEAKTPLKEQFTVTNDLEAGTVVKKKNAARKGAETASHYCGDCANKRVEQKGAWLSQRDGSTASSGSKSKGKGKAKKGSTKKAAAKPKAKGKKAVKKPGKKGVKKPAKKSASKEPF